MSLNKKILHWRNKKTRNVRSFGLFLWYQRLVLIPVWSQHPTPIGLKLCPEEIHQCVLWKLIICHSPCGLNTAYVVFQLKLYWWWYTSILSMECCRIAQIVNVIQQMRNIIFSKRALWQYWRNVFQWDRKLQICQTFHINLPDLSS